MIVITGAAGFIGSCLSAFLLRSGYTDLVLCDDFNNAEKSNNLLSLGELPKVDREELFSWIRKHHRRVQFVFHLGARTDTAEFNYDLLYRLNTGYSKQVFSICSEFGIPLVYASSAATYGDGSLGFSDEMTNPEKLKPLNPYGESKQQFDLWVLKQATTPPFWAGLKFFNVYGPNEYHKGRMASVIFHAYHQIRQTGRLKLFRSHNPDYRDGEQLRDFIFVEDISRVCLFLLQNRRGSGIYNLGSGNARTFYDLGKNVFNAMGIQPAIDYIDIPVDIRDKYQYYTEASLGKLRKAGYDSPFVTLEDGIREYVQKYLANNINY
jgi:ADP-L-glycero-D-manno-heptose 6-epimerase